MKKGKSSQRISSQWKLPAYFSFIALTGFASGIFVLAAQSEPRNQFLFGYSAPRLILGAVLFLGTLFFFALAAKAAAQRAWATHWWDKLFGPVPDVIFLRVVFVCALMGFIGNFFPSDRLGSFSGYFEQLRPALIWLAVAGSFTWLLVLISRSRENRSILLVCLVFFSTALLIWVLVGTSGLGLRIWEDYWYGAGAPILTLQALAAFGLGFLFLLKNVDSIAADRRWADLTLALLIWLATAVFWAREPLQASFFMPRATPPTNAFYPFSDGATFDIGSQYALIGQGIMNGEIFDRAAYISWLAYLHTLFGQDYEVLMAAQSAIFAILPAIVYLLGVEIHGRALGVAAGAMAAFRGANAIAASSLLDLSGPKMMLTDFPAAIFIAAFTLFVVRWLKDRNYQHALIAGGLLGVAILLRTNALLLLPGVIALAFVSVYLDTRKKKRSGRPLATGSRLRSPILLERTSLGALLMVLAMLAATLPWDFRNSIKGAPMFYLYFGRIETLIEERYQFPSGDAFRDAPGVSKASASVTRFPDPMASTELLPPCNSVICSITNHFLHNLVTSVLFLPSSFQLDGLSSAVTTPPLFWRPDWNGDLAGFPTAVWISGNLALASLGLSAAWRRVRWLGLTPAAVYFIYMLSNALARTSGGRYLVPVDWVVILYFSLGALLLIQWAATLLRGRRIASEPEKRKLAPVAPFPQKQLPVVLATIVLIGALIPLPEVIFPRRYADGLSPAAMLALLHEEHKEALAEGTGDLTTSIESFLDSNPDGRLLQGRVLYPRYYRAGQGLRETVLPPYGAFDFPRLAFTLIGPAGTLGVVLPSDPVASFPHAADVLVLGCQRAEYLETFAVFVLDDTDGSYLRSPSDPLGC